MCVYKVVMAEDTEQSHLAAVTAKLPQALLSGYLIHNCGLLKYRLSYALMESQTREQLMFNFITGSLAD